LKGKAIINATGVFTNAIMKLNDTVYKKIYCPKSKFILYLINLSTERSRPDDSKTSDRSLFAVPWHNKIVVGTTDTLVKKNSLEPIALETEINLF
jgi:glycerol-3-phosphate dehydrogenase